MLENNNLISSQTLTISFLHENITAILRILSSRYEFPTRKIRKLKKKIYAGK